ncbi:phosphopantetheine-binding protein [Salinispora vitiensis]|uniref:phosphopantetheine-binding protein n=1 Tax=Salinispora vitiensis TaxID=999544 RepID=UPI00036E6793|nr:phosphopantetheine-binding protein [Salinispora vitiensis]
MTTETKIAALSAAERRALETELLLKATRRQRSGELAPRPEGTVVPLPLSQRRVYVLDGAGAPVGPGVAGQLYQPALPATPGAGEAPRDAIELGLLEIWRLLLGVPDVGVHDDFFALGGHSLLAVQLVNRIESEFGRSEPVAALCPTSTVNRLAGIVRGGRLEHDDELYRLRGGDTTGPVLALDTGFGHEGGFDPATWQQVAGDGLTVHTVEADHYRMVTGPAVRLVARLAGEPA